MPGVENKIANLNSIFEIGVFPKTTDAEKTRGKTPLSWTTRRETMSTQKTSIKIYKSESYSTATKAARNELAKALKGGEAVDKYYRLRAQAGEILHEILNKKGFRRNANSGLYKNQNSYFYGRGNSDVMISFGIDDDYEEYLYEEREFSAFLAFDLGRDVGSVVEFKIGIDKGAKGATGAFKWSDLDELILPSIGQAAVTSYGTVLNLLRSPGKIDAKKAMQRAVNGAAYGLEFEAEYTTPKGNTAQFNTEPAEDDSLRGLAVATSGAAVTAAQSLSKVGISQSIIVQNFTDREFQLEFSYLSKESNLILFPDKSKSTHLPCAIAEGEDTPVGEADRHLAGEVQAFLRSDKEDGSIAYTLEMKDTKTGHKAAFTFNGPALGANTGFLVFNPAGSGEEIHQAHATKSQELVHSNNLDGLAVTVALNNNTGTTLDTKSGKPGYYYRALIAIHYDTDRPETWGRSPLDGLLFGPKF